MKLAEVSDAHMLLKNPIARIDDAIAAQMRKIRFILDWCRQNDASLIFAGDLSNKPRSWYLLPEMMDLFMEYDSIKKYAIFGQHDVYMYSEKAKVSTSLGILEKAGLISILSDYPLLVDEGVCLYGCSYGREIPEPNPSCMSILVIHAPIAAEALWPGQNYMDALQFLKKHDDFDYIICGDIHQKFLKKYKGHFIMNSGSLIRKEATLYNFTHKPGFFVIDTNSDDEPEFIEVPHDPAELVLSRTHIDYNAEADSMLDEFIGGIEGIDVDDGITIVDNLRKFIRDNKKQMRKGAIFELEEVINARIDA